ncbi:MAG: hypothetical protein IPM02_21715 [Betaproteobacteria bacterium]|nr:hypothetical protein [Betaproteobacteria bacterium]
MSAARVGDIPYHHPAQRAVLRGDGHEDRADPVLAIDGEAAEEVRTGAGRPLELGQALRIAASRQRLQRLRISHHHRGPVALPAEHDHAPLGMRDAVETCVGNGDVLACLAPSGFGGEADDAVRDALTFGVARADVVAADAGNAVDLVGSDVRLELVERGAGVAE